MNDHNRRRLGLAAAGLVLAALLAPVARAAAPAPPLPPLGTGALRGPTLGALISGTTSEVGGTSVWTDYAYDDHGTDATTDPATTGNVADLVQLQLQPSSAGVRIRGVLETLVDPHVPVLGIGLDLDGDPTTGAPAPPGAGWTVQGTGLGLERFVVLDDVEAAVRSWDGSRWAVAGTASSVVDPTTNTIAATIPSALLGPSGSRWRVVGLLGPRTSSGSWADGNGAVSDLAYVRDTSSTNWQSNVQAAVLSGTEDAAAAVGTVDVARLAKGVTALPQPVAGEKNTFLYRSALELGEGIGAPADRVFAGPYQPYVIWFPKEGLPPAPPMVVFLHGAMQNHLGGAYGADKAFVAGMPDLVATGVIDPAALVITPLGRGTAPLAYEGPAERDILDVIADAEARFGVDQERVVLTGYSLGGVGTFRMAQLYPDKWAGAVEIVGAPDLGALTAADEAQGLQTQPNQLENLRNLPFRLAHARADELELIVGGVQPDKAALELQRLGYDYRYWQFYRREHLSFPVDTIQCELEAGIRRGRVKDPARVTYSQEPAIQSDDPAIGLHVPHDRAYWMSDMVVRGSSFAPGDKGTVDVIDLARADRAPKATPVVDVNQNLTGGRDVCGPNPRVQTLDAWSMIGQALSPGTAQPVSNAITANLTKVASVALDLRQMGALDLTRTLRVDLTSDGDSRLRLAGAWQRAVLVDHGGQQARLCPRNGVLDLTTTAGSSSYWLTPTNQRCP